MGIKQKITKFVATLSENMITGSDIFSVIKRDHRKVTELFAEIEDLEDSDIELKMDIFTRLKTELILHSTIEEQLFYSRLGLKGDFKEHLSDAFKEHDKIRTFLDILSSQNPGKEEWLINLKNLKNTVNNHIKEEESKIFDHARVVLNEEELLKIGEAFTAEKINALKK
jgi:hypothetical protein